ncbi:MAG: apolipoprotein N-acyltransferase [Methylotenera sp.]|nr:apolipoprotein N-acyltransferase [Oligoflexia bacterium]
MRLVPTLRKIQPHPLTFLSGILLTLVFDPWNLSFLMWIALIPWFEALDRTKTRKGAFIQGMWMCFFMSIGAFSWIASVLHQYAGLPWVLGLLGLMLFGLIGQPQFTLFAIVHREIQALLQSRNFSEARGSASKLMLLGIALAAAYTGLDWVLPKLFVDSLGHAFYQWENLRQIADLGGVHLITFLIYLVNYALWDLLSRLRKRTEPSAWPALKTSAPFLIMALLLCYASVRYGVMRNEEIHALTDKAPRKIQIAAVQANIGDFDKVASESGVRGAAEKILHTFYDLSDDALKLKPRPQVLIWPETSYPSTFRTPSNSDEFARDQQLERFVQSRKTPLLFGGYDQFEHRDFNAFFFLSPRPLPYLGGGPGSNPGSGSGSSDLQIYRKSILLLFGEYIPGADRFPWIKRAFPMVGNFGRGPGPQILKIPVLDPQGNIDGEPILANPVICYEALYPQFVIDAVRKGSRLIVNITNDSWFGDYGEPVLHLSLTVFRSIETRTPQIRSTNTGITTLILPDGSMPQQTKLFVPEILNVAVPILAPVSTLMLRWGDWFGFAALCFGFFVLSFYWVHVLRSRRS